jgi:hypothetical protein
MLEDVDGKDRVEWLDGSEALRFGQLVISRP